MAYQFPPDVAKLVEDQLRHGQYASVDDVLRSALVSLVDLAEAQCRHGELTERLARSQSQAEDGNIRPLDTDATLAEGRRRLAKES